MAIADVTDALSDLQESISIEVSIAGSRVNGSWVSGGVNTISEMAVVQPASNEDMNVLSQSGDQTHSYKKFYSKYQFKTASSKDKTEADIIVYQGEKFKVLSVSDYKQLGGYFKAVSVRIEE